MTITQTVYEDDGVGSIAEYAAICKFADDGFGTVPASIMGRLRSDTPETDENDRITTVVSVAKQNTALLEPIGAAGPVRARTRFDHYAVNYVD